MLGARYFIGNAFSTDPTLLAHIDHDVSDVRPQDFVNTFLKREVKLINAAIHS